ncbi:MAG: type II toxin-antitoxin system YoeB family toxin [Selenomonas sp.]|nr:type II toxin-antitoxin system YoeB family toxin [Selenomonas sp.]
MGEVHSRRIDGENRLVYGVSGDTINIISCKGHYED